MVSEFLVASVATIIPGLAALFYLLNRYEGYFEDARVFFSLVVGFFAGLVVAFLENVAFAFDSASFVAAAGPATAFMFFVGGYALVESAAKTVVLGAGRFRRRKDTPYYGAALGIGFGAMMALQSVALALQRTGLLDGGLFAIAQDGRAFVTAAAILLAAIGAILTAGASGVWAGKGSAEGRLWRGLAHAALLTMPLLALLWFFRSSVGDLGNLLAYAAASAFLAAAYGAGLVVLTQRRILDTIVPPEIRDQVRKERRRSQRARRSDASAVGATEDPSTDAVDVAAEQQPPSR